MTESASEAQPPNARVLVVDDDRALRELVQEDLESEGYEVAIAPSAERALAMLAEHHERVPFHRAVTHVFPLVEAELAMRTALGADTAMKVVICPAGPI